MPSLFFARGVTLVELIVAIVVIGVALAGVLVVIVRNTESSADPMVWHQATAIGEAYLEEILSKDFTDPDGSNVGETRATFDDVLDYNGLTDIGARDQNNNPIAGLGGYTVTVKVTAPPAPLNGIAPANVWLVQVTVASPFGGSVVLGGYRTNY
ncbi:MAG: type IV pilus modification PilV family protein [Sulfuricaulis sp.]